MFEFITKAVVAISLAIGSLFTPQTDVPIMPAQDQSIERDRIANRVEQLESQVETLGAYNPSGGGTYRLKTSIGTTNTTITLSSFKEPVSEVPYTMTYLNTSVAYGTLDPQNTTRSEFISFTGITQNADGSATLTGVTRGLARSYPFTASSTLRQAHSGQSIFILSDSPQHFSEYAVKQNNETITGQWTFSVFPITASTSFASETVGGIVELATGTEAASSTASGTIARLALPASLATSSCQVVGRYVPITDPLTGRIDAGCLDTTYASSSLTIGSTPILDIGKNVWATTSSGTSTFAVPSGVTKIKVTVIGGGGGGGSCSVANPGSGAGQGGTGGSWAISWYDVSATTSIQIVVGKGGTATANGDPSKFASIIAPGGIGGGSETTGINDASVIASGGTLNGKGSPGESGHSEQSTNALHDRDARGGESIFGGQFGMGGTGFGCSAGSSRGGGTAQDGAIIIEW